MPEVAVPCYRPKMTKDTDAQSCVEQGVMVDHRQKPEVESPGPLIETPDNMAPSTIHFSWV